jgi:hypothetical protein
MEREYEFKKLELINDSKKKDLNLKKKRQWNWRKRW